jgi:hypothetical protein
VQRRQVRCDALAALCRASATLQSGAPESPRWRGGWYTGRPLSDPRIARVRWRNWQLSPHRADPGWHHDLLRRGSGAGMAAQHCDERQTPSPGEHPPMVRRLPRALGGQHPGRVEILGEPAIDWRQKLACCGPPALSAPQPREPRRGRRFGFYSTSACMTAFSKSRSSSRLGLLVCTMRMPTIFSFGSTQKCVPKAPSQP